jgi:hypothetical protein
MKEGLVTAAGVSKNLGKKSSHMGDDIPSRDEQWRWSVNLVK